MSEMGQRTFIKAIVTSALAAADVAADSLGGLFVFIPNFLRMKEAHRSGADKRRRFDHPPPSAFTGRTRGSKSDLGVADDGQCTGHEQAAHVVRV
jgi:hypothetical protein